MALAGALGALAMPPLGFIPALALALTVAVWVLDGVASSSQTKTRQVATAGYLGWWFGFGYSLAGLWWIGQAFLVDADSLAWLIPVAVLGVPAILGLFYGLGFALALVLWRPGPCRILAFAVSLAGAEWLRGHLATGFPWNAFGYALAQDIRLAQILALIGLPGLTLLAIVILAAPATLAEGPFRSWQAWRGPASALFAGLVLFCFGLWRLHTTEVGLVPDVRLRIMQPALPQDEKFKPSLRNEILQRYFALSRRETADGEGLRTISHLIWPESAFPFILSQDRDALRAIGELLVPGGILLTGAGRIEVQDRGEPLYYNSLHIINDRGGILRTYDKVHLVPFGEYLPFQATLEAIGLQQLTRQRGGFSPGQTRRVLHVPGAPPVGVLICYEAIFPGQVVDPDNRPGWLLNVTNDAWFGMTPGPHQHFLQARMRTIEEGLPLVRAANNGISAVVDPLGQVKASLPLGQVDVLDADLPAALSPTLYSVAGDLLFLCLLCTFLLPLMLCKRSR